ncbi:MAG: hypothetical protein LBQ97_00115 [Fusobacteriaceae bacterium]|jgi:hypothetical protein|nr:hypothetical protein [Fusobacteriaceae bacterium]
MYKKLIAGLIRAILVTVPAFGLNAAQCWFEMIEYKAYHSAFFTAYGVDVFYAALLTLAAVPVVFAAGWKLPPFLKLPLLTLVFLVTALWANCFIFEARVTPVASFTPKEILAYVLLYHQAYAVLATFLYYGLLRLIYRFLP